MDTNDSLAQHYREVSHRLLTAEEEQDLAKRIEAGDKRAKEIFFRHNMRYVLHIALRYKKAFKRLHTLDLLDLIQEGYFGLMRAVEGYQWRKGNRFTTYATWWIRQAITRSIFEKERGIRIPVYLEEEFRRFLSSQENLATLLGHEPSIDDIAADMNVSPSRVQAILEYRHLSTVLSLDQPVGEHDGEAMTIADTIEDTDFTPEEVVIESLYQDFQQELVQELLAKLPERYRTVIVMRFGLDGRGVRTLDEIGEHLGVTRERIRQIQDKVLARLEQFLARELRTKREGLV